MRTYSVSRLSGASGSHEVHDRRCPNWPNGESLQILGLFDSHERAVEVANLYYSDAVACSTCLNLESKSS